MNLCVPLDVKCDICGEFKAKYMLIKVEMKSTKRSAFSYAWTPNVRTKRTCRECKNLLTKKELTESGKSSKTRK